MKPYHKQRTQASTKTLSIRAKARINFLVILVLIGFFGLIIYPVLPDSFPGVTFFSKFFPHLGLDLQGGTHLVYEANLGDIPADEHSSALEGARDVIERRVNTLGVAEPLVQTARRGNSSRVIVELAGVQDVKEAIALIGETPLLEFKEVSTEKSAAIDEDNHQSDIITAIQDLNRKKEALANATLDRIKNGESFEDLAKELSEDTGSKSLGGSLGWAVRGDFTPLFEKAVFDDLAVGEVATELVKTDLGYHIIRKDDERVNDAGETEVLSSHILFKTESLQEGDSINWINTELSGKQLKRAQVVFDHQSGIPQVTLTFNSEGGKLFEEITRRNIGQPVGIFLDGGVISSPVVQTVISGGQAVITGNFTLDEAKTLVQRLNAGALPVPIELISQQTIGASLGSESLVKSLNAAIIGLILVAAFMILYYLLPGILSVFALGAYAIVTIGIFETLPVTLTLAGIAGFILSIGMAVDANVLIFERIKEELRRGVNFKDAIEEGFKRAWPSIRDSNISSLITCVILYWFGSSIIKGFAVTLGIGILVSMFSAITVTRTFLRLLVQQNFSHKKWLFGIYRNKNNE